MDEVVGARLLSSGDDQESDERPCRAVRSQLLVGGTRYIHLASTYGKAEFGAARGRLRSHTRDTGADLRRLPRAPATTGPRQHRLRPERAVVSVREGLSSACIPDLDPDNNIRPASARSRQVRRLDNSPAVSRRFGAPVVDPVRATAARIAVLAGPGGRIRHCCTAEVAAIGPGKAAPRPSGIGRTEDMHGVTGPRNRDRARTSHHRRSFNNGIDIVVADQPAGASAQYRRRELHAESPRLVVNVAADRDMVVGGDHGVDTYQRPPALSLYKPHFRLFQKIIPEFVV